MRAAARLRLPEKLRKALRLRRKKGRRGRQQRRFCGGGTAGTGGAARKARPKRRTKLPRRSGLGRKPIPPAAMALILRGLLKKAIKRTRNRKKRLNLRNA